MEKREYQAENPATGETRGHPTKTGAAVDQAVQDVKSYIPGTKTHEMSQGTTTMTGEKMGHEGAGGMGSTMGATSTHTTTGTTGMTGMGHQETTGTTTGHHSVINPATGEKHEHGTRAGAAIHQAYENVKEFIPGTKEHKATHPQRQL